MFLKLMCYFSSETLNVTLTFVTLIIYIVMKLQSKCIEVFALVDVWTMVCLLIQNWTAFFFSRKIHYEYPN